MKQDGHLDISTDFFLPANTIAQFADCFFFSASKKGSNWASLQKPDLGFGHELEGSGC
jgi:hypothetical protein